MTSDISTSIISPAAIISFCSNSPIVVLLAQMSAKLCSSLSHACMHAWTCHACQSLEKSRCESWIGPSQSILQQLAHHMTSYWQQTVCTMKSWSRTSLRLCWPWSRSNQQVLFYSLLQHLCIRLCTCNASLHACSGSRSITRLCCILG